MHKLAAAYIIATSRTQFLLLILKPEKQEKVWKKKCVQNPTKYSARIWTQVSL